MSHSHFGSDYQAVLARISIPDYFSRFHGLRTYNIQGRAIECPFHDQPESGPSFLINREGTEYSCSECGRSGNVITLDSELAHCSQREAIERLANQAGITVANPTTRDRRVEVLRAAADFFYSNVRSDNAVNYLASRGISSGTIMNFRLGYAPNSFKALQTYLSLQGFTLEEMLSQDLVARSDRTGDYYDKFRDRLMAPVFDHKGLPVGFSGRDMSGNVRAPKYLNTRSTDLFTKGNVLFNLDRVVSLKALRKFDRIYVTEGQFDLMIAVQSGIENIVCPLGTAFNIGHAKLLKNHCREITFVFDNDRAGKDAALKAGQLAYEAGLTPSYILLPSAGEKVDLDSFLRSDSNPKERFLQLPRLDIVQFYLETDERNRVDPDSRLQVVDGGLDLLMHESELSRRMSWMRHLGEAVGYPELVEQRFRERIKPRVNQRFSREKLIWDYLANLRFLTPEQARRESESISLESSFLTEDQRTIYQAVIEQPHVCDQTSLFHEPVNPLQFLTDLKTEGKIIDISPYFVRVLESRKPRYSLESCKRALTDLIKADTSNLLVEQIRFLQSSIERISEKGGDTQKLEESLERLAARLDGLLLESNGN